MAVRICHHIIKVESSVRFNLICICQLYPFLLAQSQSFKGFFLLSNILRVDYELQRK